MQSHKRSQAHANLINSRELVLYAANFPNGFVNFMEALVRDGVVSADYNRQPGAIGFRWTDDRASGGVLVETEKHPMTGSAGTVLFEGIPAALDLVKRELELQGVSYAQ